ncbi:MAG: hypothetical protein JXR48_16160 [Candidatus Delongbacteria bacterium]|nr:hypothetical protein [Candidatus Delongbacteria bacterium]MBN2836493.1 hypothetical protein [Candidatus Delongbacteria bacterium]
MYSKEEVEKIIEFAKNNGYVEASRVFNVSRKTIYNWANKERKKPGRKRKIEDDKKRNIKELFDSGMTVKEIIIHENLNITERTLYNYLGLSKSLKRKNNREKSIYVVPIFLHESNQVIIVFVNSENETVYTVYSSRINREFMEIALNCFNVFSGHKNTFICGKRYSPQYSDLTFIENSSLIAILSSNAKKLINNIKESCKLSNNLLKTIYTLQLDHNSQKEFVENYCFIPTINIDSFESQLIEIRKDPEIILASQSLGSKLSYIYGIFNDSNTDYLFDVKFRDHILKALSFINKEDNPLTTAQLTFINLKLTKKSVTEDQIDKFIKDVQKLDKSIIKATLLLDVYIFLIDLKKFESVEKLLPILESDFFSNLLVNYQIRKLLYDGKYYSVKSEFEKAEMRFNDAEKLIVDESLSGVLNQYRADMYKLRGDPGKAIEIYQKSIKQSESVKDYRIVINSHVGAASSYLELGQYKKGIGEYYKIAEMIKKYGTFYDQVYLNIVLANLYNMDDNFKNSLKHYRQASIMTKSHNMESSYFQILNGISILLARINFNRMAFRFSRKFVNYAKKTNDKDITVTSLLNMGLILKSLNFLQLSVSFLQKGYILAEELKNIRKQFGATIALCEGYIALDQYPEVIKYSKIGQDLSLRIHHEELKFFSELYNQYAKYRMDTLTKREFFTFLDNQDTNYNYKYSEVLNSYRQGNG